jgi:foldase protein PrsA
MKLTSKFWIAIIVAVIIAITGYTIFKMSGSNDRHKVVAEINGEKILKGEVIDIYNGEKGNYGITEEIETDPEQKEAVLGLKTGILESLVYQKLVNQEAIKAGYTVNDKVLEEAKKDFESIVKGIEEQMKSEAGEGSEKNTDYAEEAEEYINNELVSMGKTKDEYIKIMAEQKIVEQLREKITADVKITDADIKSYYDSQLKIQKGAPDARGMQDVVLYNQPGVRVKHILIQLPEDQQKEFNKLVGEQKAAEAQKYLDEKLKTIYPRAQEVLSKSKKGEDFEKLIKDYGQDPGMIANSEGYTVKQNGQFVPEFEEASLKLKKGEISNLVQSSFGYHIIKAYEIIPEKIYSLQEKKNEIKELVTSQKKNEKWGSTVEEWMKKGTIKKYENML